MISPVNRFTGGKTDSDFGVGLLFAMVGHSVGPMDSRQNSTEQSWEETGRLVCAH